MASPLEYREFVQRPGWQTTEFYLVVVAAAAGLALTLANRLDADTYWQWLVGGVGVYSLSRGIVKK